MSECETCAGRGEIDPEGVDDGSPLYIECGHCFGVGLTDCSTCQGSGIVVVAVDCPTCSEPQMRRHDAAA